MEGLDSHNILYYSKFCKHCNKVIEYLAKHGLTQDLNCICVDRRTVSPQGQVLVQLENGKQEGLPPMIDKVPALLLVKEKYQVRYGNDILSYFKKGVQEAENEATQCNQEPRAFSTASFSDSFSSYS